MFQFLYICIFVSDYLKWKISLMFYCCLSKKRNTEATTFPGWPSTAATFFSHFPQEIAFMKISSHGGRYYRNLKWGGKDKVWNQWSFQRANIRPGLIFVLKTRHFLNLLCIVLDIKLCLGISPFPETTPKNQEYMSASSDCCGVGKGMALMQSDRESQAGSL